MKFQENDRAKINIDSYTYIELRCCYVEGNIVYFVHEDSNINYKYDSKKNKSYRYNPSYNSWDTLEENISLMTSEFIWENRKLDNTNYFGD